MGITLSFLANIHGNDGKLAGKWSFYRVPKIFSDIFPRKRTSSLIVVPVCPVSVRGLRIARSLLMVFAASTGLILGCTTFGWLKPYTLWLCQNSYGKWRFVVDFPIKNGDFP